MPEIKQRYYYLDFIKIISAFMITFYHAAYYRLDYGFIEGTAYIPNLNRIFMSLCVMSVPLFFMVSGALMFKRPQENRIISVILIIAGWAMVIAEVTIETNLLNKMFDGVNASFPTIGALCMAVGAFSLMKTFRYCEKTTKIITYISPYVLSIYVMHVIIIKGLTNLMHIESMTFIAALSFAIMVDAIAVCIGWIINKIPYLREVIKI